MPDILTVDIATIQQWIAAKLEPETVELKLKEKGLDEDAVTRHLRAFRKLKNAKRQATGFMSMGLGALLGFISCLLTVVNPVPSLYYVILFGLTSIAVLLICLGMYFVFE